MYVYVQVCLFPFMFASTFINFMTRLEAVFFIPNINLTSTSFVNMKLECYKLMFCMIRQMIDQETITPFALIKNVHALVVDFIFLKKGLAVSETTIVRQQQTVQETQNGHN